MDDAQLSSSEDTITPTAKTSPWALGFHEGVNSSGLGTAVSHRARPASSSEAGMPPGTDSQARNTKQPEDGQDVEKWLTFLEQQYVESTMDEGAMLQTAMEEAASHLTTDSNSICGPRPLFAMLPTPAFKVAMVGLFLLHLALGIGYCLTTVHRHSHASTTFLMEITEVRDATQGVRATNVVDFGFSFKGCRLHGMVVNVSESQFQVSFERLVEIDGFFIAVGGSNPAFDPTEIRISYLNCEAQESSDFILINQPKWWTDWGAQYASAETWELYASNRVADEVLTSHMQTNAPAAWSIGVAVESAIICIGSLVALVAVVFHKYTVSGRVLSVTLAAVMLQSLALSILLLSTQDWRLSFRWLRGFAVSALLTPCVALPGYEKALVPVFLVSSLANLVLLLADHVVVRGMPGALLGTQEVYVGTGMLCVGVFLAVRWSRMLRSVRLLVKQDQAAFEEAWKQILSTTPIDTIDQLCRTVKKFSPSSSRGRPVQQIRASRNLKPSHDTVTSPIGEIPSDLRERERSFTLKHRCRTLLNSDGTRHKVEPGPVGSLDQLYAQAASCSLLFRRTAQHAALASNGAFPVTPRPAFRGPEGDAQNFMTLHDIQRTGMPLSPVGRRGGAGRAEGGAEEVDDGADQDAVQWTDLKPARRAIDKVLKQYHGEVHRLLDVCRESVVFDDFLGIDACVRALASDPQVVIERIKNSLDPTLDASATAGFRAVSVNLRVVSPLSRWLCVDGHVCELLLTLRPLAQCMTHQSHQQYLQLRNFRVANRLPGLLSSLLPYGRWVAHAPQEPPLSFILSSPKAQNSARRLPLVDETAGKMPGSQPASLQADNPSDLLPPPPAQSGFGEFVSRSLPSVGSLVPTRWRRNRVHSVDDVELGTGGMLGASALMRTDSPFRAQVDQERRFLGDDGAWVAPGAGAVHAVSSSGDVGAGVFGDIEAAPTALRRSSLSSLTASPPKLNRAAASNLSTESRPLRLRRTSVSLIREESGQTDTYSIEREGGRWLSVDDLGEKGSRMEMLRWQYVRRVLLPGGLLDQLRCRFEAAVADVELFSVFETSYPIAAALCKRPVRYALLCSILLYAFMVFVDTQALRSLGQIKDATRLRFRPTRLRGGGDPASMTPAVHRIGLMQDGCMVDTDRHGWLQCTRAECIVELGGSWDFNGFYFVTNDGPRAHDPVGFTLDAQGNVSDGQWRAGDNEGWVRVASWRRMVTLSGGQEWLMRRRGGTHGAETNTTTEMSALASDLDSVNRGSSRLQRFFTSSLDQRKHRGTSGGPHNRKPDSMRDRGGVVVQVEMRAPWHAWLGSWTLDFTAMITAMALWCVSKAERPGWGKCIVVGSLMCVGCCLAVNAGAETIARGSAGAFPVQWANAGAMVAIGVGLMVREQLALVLWLYAGVHFIVMREVEDWMVYDMWGDGTDSSGLASYPIASYVFVVVGALFILMRRRLHVLSGRGIEQDILKYRQAWRRLCADEEERAALERIGSLCSSAWAVTIANGGAQQRCRVRDPDGAFNTSRRSPSVGAAKFLDFFAGWSSSRKNSQHSRRRLSSVVLGSKSLVLETRRASSRRSSSIGPRSPAVGLATPSMARTPIHPHRDSDGNLRTPESAVRAPDPIAVTPDDSVSGASGTRVVMLSTVRRRSAAEAAAGPSPEQSGLWTKCKAVVGLGSSGRASADAHRAFPRAESSGSLSRSGSRWRFGSSSGSRSTWRSASSRGDPDSDGWLRSFRFGWKGWRSTRKSVTSKSSGRLSRTGSMGGGAGAGEGRAGTRRVQSLDQLYVQAAGVHPLLKEKVKAWAWSTRGYLRVKPNSDRAGTLSSSSSGSSGGGHFERWDRLAGDAKLERMVRWATLKKRQRASEKLVRSYQGKVWKLLDICRQSLVFDSAADLADCLHLILQDQAVVVCSLKNRLALEYDDKETAGYRDVNINLCFRSDVASELAVDNHVCEVQLLLRSFAQLKTDDGHVRYVRFRNARAQ